MKNIVDFLIELKDNNNKEWFSKNKKQYEQAKNTFIEIIDEILGKCSDFEPNFNNLKAKDCIFRINRDIRFSNDKSPYKINFGASLNPKGKKSKEAGYYLHIQPGECFLGGGIYMPDPETLKKLRQEIDYNYNDLLNIITEKEFKKCYPSIFNEDKLSKPPKGYEATNPAIDYLKLKHFIFMHNFKESDIKTINDLTELCVYNFQQLRPFNDFLNRIFEN